VTSLSESRSELDAIIADIELTLVSIIQGFALTVLIETSREAIATFDWINFLYIACALVEAFAFAQLGNPARWFAFVAAFLAVGWLLFAYDLRLIRTRVCDHTGEVSNRLYALVKRDQRLNLGLLLPAFFLVNVAFAILIHLRPEFFLQRGGHIWLIALQLIAFAGYLSYVVIFYSKLAPLIAPARARNGGRKAVPMRLPFN